MAQDADINIDEVGLPEPCFITLALSTDLTLAGSRTIASSCRRSRGCHGRRRCSSRSRRTCTRCGRSRRKGWAASWRTRWTGSRRATRRGRGCTRGRRGGRSACASTCGREERAARELHAMTMMMGVRIKQWHVCTSRKMKPS